jgi:all-trans-retinol dehydrogenase (NAD+)
MAGVPDIIEAIGIFAADHYILAGLIILFFIRAIINLTKVPKSLKGEIVFITGAASGIGRKMALGLSKLGAKVIVADIDFNSALKVAQEIQNDKNEALAVLCDVTSIESIKKASEIVKSQLGASPSILINNAGIVSGAEITKLTYEKVERTFKVNAISHFYTIKEFLPDMLKANKGHIVTIASAAGTGGVNKLTDYCASKYAAVGLDDSLRNELRAMNSQVKTTCVCPYYINTGMFEGVKSKFSLILPILNEDWVTSKIIQAIRYDQKILILPSLLSYCLILKSILPAEWTDLIGDFIGLQDSMETFKGRKP